MRLGEHNLALEDDGASPVDYGVVERIIHSEYSPRSYDNDIALLVLDRDVEYDEGIAPVCLPLINERVEQMDFAGSTPHIAGWGATRFRGPASAALLEIQLKVEE